ncbi:MAG: DUF6311 domain-containing protein [Oscillospiraceae bacterium]
MFSEKKDGKIVFFGGFILGIIAFLIIYGVKVLDFTYDGWLLQGSGFTGDLTQHYLGWVYFRDSDWSFPLGLIENLSYPDKISIIYTDSIPLFAIIFKIFSQVLPETFQYFGLWGVISFALQGGFAAILIKKYTKSIPLCIISSAFFVIAPIMLRRMFFHTALAAHWIILAAICLWIYQDEIKKSAVKSALWLSLVGLCVLVNLYFSPIIIGILICASIGEILKKKAYFAPILTSILSIFVTFILMYIFGGFYGGVSAKMGGLGTFSFNLNGFYNPFGTSYFSSEKEIFVNGQNEGFAYLGVGMIILLAVAVFIFMLSTRKKGDFSGKIAALVPFAIAVFVFVFLALSPVVTFNGKNLFTIPYTEKINEMLSIFRSSGRFIWPVYYLLMIFAFSQLAKVKKTAVIGAFVTICLGLQTLDFQKVFAESHSYFASQKVYLSPLKSNFWKDIAKSKKHIMFYAPIWNIYVEPNIGYNFAVYAKNNDLTLNGVYFSRDLSTQIDTKTLEHFERLKTDKTFGGDTIYIFTGEIPQGDFGLKYQKIDGFNVGIKK